MANKNPLPLDVAAYLSDTPHLNTEQHGCYLLILMAMWRAGGWIDGDRKTVVNICKIHINRWNGLLLPVLALLSRGEDGRLSQKRLQAELKTGGGDSQGGLPVKPRGGTRCKPLKNNDPGFLPLETPTTVLTSLSESKTDSESKKASLSGRAIAKPCRLPPDWKPNTKHYAAGEEFAFTVAQVDGFAEDMRLWAESNAHRSVTRKSNWDATFLGWVRREGQRQRDNPRGGNGGSDRQSFGFIHNVIDAATRR